MTSLKTEPSLGFVSGRRMAANLKEMCSLDILVLYENDSLYAKYSDGTSLQLSSCGSAFVHRETPPSLSHVHHLTRYAISSFRSKISQAIHIRNLFAARPYICKELTDSQQLQVGYQSVSGCSWPMTATADFITELSDGSVCVKSIDGLASLTLLPHRQAFTVRFLVEVKNSLPPKDRTHSRGPLTDASNRKESKEPESQEKKYYFTWLEQIHSVSFYPETWRYPLQLALHVGCHDLCTSPSQTSNVTPLPASLPITCNAAHLHKWKEQVSSDSGSSGWDIFWQPNIKVIWKDGATYRIFRQSSGLFTIEVHPADGSVMRSHGPTGHFFTHWFSQTNESKIEERVYTTKTPPPDQLSLKLGYSVARLIKQAAGFMESLSKAGQKLEERCCWIEASKSTAAIASIPPNPAHLIETAHVPGTGRFKAYSNGHINVVFADRTILDLRNYVDHKGTETSSWGLILPNGEVHQQECAAYQNGSNSRYIQTAQHWAEWVKATPSQRRTFYKDTIWDPDKRGAIAVEMEKIQRFKYILDQKNSVHRRDTTATTTEELQDDQDSKELCVVPDRELMIKGALEQTNKAIDDIDGLLSSVKCRYQKLKI